MIIRPEIIFFVLFCLLVSTILVLDLTVIGKKSHVLSLKESLIWTAVWVTIAMLFYFFLAYHGEKIHGIKDMKHLIEVQQKYAPHLSLDKTNLSKSIEIYRQNMATEYITGYVVEYTLSVDNIFVMLLILTGFSVQAKFYKKVLFWGILGAILLRCIFIFVGAALIQKFEWILFLFGAFLIFSGIKMYIERNETEKIEPHNHWLVKFLSNHLPVFQRYVGGNFFIRKNRKAYITPMLIVLILIEFTDLIFAFDSIPAIFAVTRDPFVVFFSNIFAIIGLRSLFFLLAKIVNLFRFLKIGVAVLLAFVGVKLLVGDWLQHIGFKTIYSLYIILSILAVSILFSLLFPLKTKEVA
jgi:tellurite resistance protein TerC